MHKLKYILFSFILLTLLPLSVKADCQSDFKAIEDQFKVTYTYDINTDEFTITLINPNFHTYSYLFDELYESSERVVENEKITATIKKYKKTSYTYSIYGIKGECSLQKLKEETIELKKYNKYAESDLCKGNEDFALCQKDYDKQISNETFESRLETYKQSVQKNDDKEKNTDTNEQKVNENKNNFLNNVINYAKENALYLIFIVIFSLIIIATIVTYTKSIIKSRRLE